MAPPEETPPAKPPSKSQSARERNLSLDVLSAKLKKNYEFFAGLNEEELVAFLRLCEAQTYQQGELIFGEGEREELWYIILSGRVLIFRGDKELGHIGDGECFGEVGLLKDQPRSASARAEVETMLLAIQRKNLYEEFPALGYKVIEYAANQLADKLSRANIRIENPRVDKLMEKVGEFTESPPEEGAAPAG